MTSIVFLLSNNVTRKHESNVLSYFMKSRRLNWAGVQVGKSCAEIWQMGSFRAPEHNDSQSITDQQGNYSGALLRTPRSITITLTNVCHLLFLLPNPLKAPFFSSVSCSTYSTFTRTCTQSCSTTTDKKLLSVFPWSTAILGMDWAHVAIRGVIIHLWQRSSAWR